MSEDDLPNALGALRDLSRFPTLPDRLQQGFLDFLYIGRALVNPQGLAANPAFRDAGGPLIDTPRLFYYGNSQGGIAGGALTAIAPDFNRSVLYVGRDELQPAGRAQRRLRPVRSGARRLLSGPPRAPAAAVADPDALGPRRAERLRLAHDERPAAEHAAAQGAAAPLLRRPPGRERRDGDRGAHDRLAAARAGGRPGPPHRRPALLRHPARIALPLGRRRDARGVGHRPAARRRSARRRRRPRTRRRASASTRTTW